MSSLVTKVLAVTAIFVVVGATALVPAAHAWSADNSGASDTAVSIIVDGSDWGNMRDVAVADDGSFFACGHFRGSTDLDPDPANAVTVNPAGQPGLVVKLNQDGNYEWHALVNTPNGSISQCVVAADGSVYATGFFRSHAWVVNSSQKVFTGMGSNKDNAFVAKFAPDGTGEWIRSPKRKNGNPGDGARSYGYGIDVDAAGNAYITGVFKKNVDLNLDAGDANVDFHNATGGTWYNTYLIKLDTGGNTQWSRSWGGTENTFGRAVVVDNDGDIVVGGWTNPVEMDLDPDPVDELLVGIPSGTSGATDDKNRQWWLSKFDSDGDLAWGHWFGSSSRDELNGLAVDEVNNIYATGAAGVNNRIATGGDWQTDPSQSPIEITGVKHRDIVTAKFDPSGATQWVEIYGGNGTDLYGLGIAVSGDTVYSTGRFNWTVDFTGGTSTTVVPGRVENAGSQHDPYLVGHNTADGSFVCAAAILGKSSHEGLGNASGIAADSAGNVYVAGYFHNSVDFDSGANDVPFTSAGNSDGFVARYAPDCALDAAAETTDVEDPIVEDPIVEDPIVEDPIVEDPIVEDPIVEDPEDVTPVPDVVDPEPIVDPGTVDITGDILCSAVQVAWAPDVDGEIQSFVLATKAPGATWTAHSTHIAATDRITIGGLVDGTHAFRVMAVLVDGPPVRSDELPVEVSSCAPVIPDVEDVVVEPIADEVMVEPIVEDVVVEPIADEVMVEPIVEDVVVEIVEENDTDDDTVLIQGFLQTPNGGEGPSNGTNPEANNISPGTSGTGADGNSRTSINLDNDGIVESGFSEGARSPFSSSTLATAAGIAAAAGLGLFGVGARLGTTLLRFLGSTGAGLFLIGLFRRDRRPGAPEDFVVFSSGQITNLVWTAPTAGTAPDRYIVEGFVNGYWREVFEFGTNVCRAGVPSSEVEGICNWRLRAANEHGVGKPSNEAILEAGTAEATADLPMAA